MESLNQSERIVLCKRNSSCCPTIDRVNPDTFIISDDYNGKVQLTKDQFEMLKDAYDTFEVEILKV